MLAMGSELPGQRDILCSKGRDSLADGSVDRCVFGRDAVITIRPTVELDQLVLIPSSSLLAVMELLYNHSTDSRKGLSSTGL